jgi:putative transposase
MKSRNRTPSQVIGYGLYLYFLGLSFRNTAKALSFLLLVKISHVSIWNWIQKNKPHKLKKKKKNIDGYIIDETAIKVGSELIWLWVVIEPLYKEILAINISKERNMFLLQNVFYLML